MPSEGNPPGSSIVRRYDFGCRMGLQGSTLGYEGRTPGRANPARHCLVPDVRPCRAVRVAVAIRQKAEILRLIRAFSFQPRTGNRKSVADILIALGSSCRAFVPVQGGGLPPSGAVSLYQARQFSRRAASSWRSGRIGGTQLFERFAGVEFGRSRHRRSLNVPTSPAATDGWTFRYRRPVQKSDVNAESSPGEKQQHECWRCFSRGPFALQQ